MTDDVDDDDGEVQLNDHLVMISGESATGKSASLRNLKGGEKIAYLNCESGKRLPFKNKFSSITITDPFQVYDAFDQLKDDPDFEGIIVDTQTFLMDMYESQYVLTAPKKETMAAWGGYAQFFKNLMQQKVAASDKWVIFTAHTRSDFNEEKGIMETKVPVKGALQNNGIESYFSTVVSTKRMTLKSLEKYENDLLVITPLEESLGFKYVFQTQLTRDTIGERIRAPMGMFTTEETFIDNDAQKLMDRLQEYYA